MLTAPVAVAAAALLLAVLTHHAVASPPFYGVNLGGWLLLESWIVSCAVHEYRFFARLSARLLLGNRRHHCIQLTMSRKILASGSSVKP